MKSFLKRWWPLLVGVVGVGILLWRDRSDETRATVVRLEKRVAELEEKWKEQGDLLMESGTNQAARMDDLMKAIRAVADTLRR